MHHLCRVNYVEWPALLKFTYTIEKRLRECRVLITFNPRLGLTSVYDSVQIEEGTRRQFIVTSSHHIKQ